MTVNFIYEPVVHLIANSKINIDELNNWASYHKLINTNGPLKSILTDSSDDTRRIVEFAGRHCYRSWIKGRDRNSYMKHLIEVGHESVFEHSSFTFAISGISRSCSHELVRHRIASYSQESQRYVDMDEFSYIVPPLLIGTDREDRFKAICENNSELYLTMKQSFKDELTVDNRKIINECLRSVLLNSIETALVWTVNVRSIRNFLKLRNSPFADKEIARLAKRIQDIVINNSLLNKEELTNALCS